MLDCSIISSVFANIMSSHSACKKSNNTDTLNTQKLEGRGNSRAVFEGGRGITYLCCSHRWTQSASLDQEFRRTRCRFLRRTQRRTRCRFLRRTQRRTRCLFLQRTQRRHDAEHKRRCTTRWWRWPGS